MDIKLQETLKQENRCDCGRLLFVKTNKGFEFKCQRCKRIHCLHFDQVILDYLTMYDDCILEARDHESSAQTSERGGMK